MLLAAIRGHEPEALRAVYNVLIVCLDAGDGSALHKVPLTILWSALLESSISVILRPDDVSKLASTAGHPLPRDGPALSNAAAARPVFRLKLLQMIPFLVEETLTLLEKFPRERHAFDAEHALALLDLLHFLQQPEALDGFAAGNGCHSAPEAKAQDLWPTSTRRTGICLVYFLIHGNSKLVRELISKGHAADFCLKVMSCMSSSADFSIQLYGICILQAVCARLGDKHWSLLPFPPATVEFLRRVTRHARLPSGTSSLLQSQCIPLLDEFNRHFCAQDPARLLFLDAHEAWLGEDSQTRPDASWLSCPLPNDGEAESAAGAMRVGHVICSRSSLLLRHLERMGTATSAANPQAPASPLHASPLQDSTLEIPLAQLSKFCVLQAKNKPAAAAAPDTVSAPIFVTFAMTISANRRLVPDQASAADQVSKIMGAFSAVDAQALPRQLHVRVSFPATADLQLFKSVIRSRIAEERRRYGIASGPSLPPQDIPSRSQGPKVSVGLVLPQVARGDPETPEAANSMARSPRHPATSERSDGNRKRADERPQSESADCLSFAAGDSFVIAAAAPADVSITLPPPLPQPPALPVPLPALLPASSAARSTVSAAWPFTAVLSEIAVKTLSAHLLSDDCLSQLEVSGRQTAHRIAAVAAEKQVTAHIAELASAALATVAAAMSNARQSLEAAEAVARRDIENLCQAAMQRAHRAVPDECGNRPPGQSARAILQDKISQMAGELQQSLGHAVDGCLFRGSADAAGSTAGGRPKEPCPPSPPESVSRHIRESLHRSRKKVKRGLSTKRRFSRKSRALREILLQMLAGSSDESDLEETSEDDTAPDGAHDTTITDHSALFLRGSHGPDEQVSNPPAEKKRRRTVAADD